MFNGWPWRAQTRAAGRIWFIQVDNLHRTFIVFHFFTKSNGKQTTHSNLLIWLHFIQTPTISNDKSSCEKNVKKNTIGRQCRFIRDFLFSKKSNLSYGWITLNACRNEKLHGSEKCEETRDPAQAICRRWGLICSGSTPKMIENTLGAFILRMEKNGRRHHHHRNNIMIQELSSVVKWVERKWVWIVCIHSTKI